MTRPKTSISSETLVEAILGEFDEHCVLLDQFRLVTERLIIELLQSQHLRFHSVTSRLKTRDSLSQKIARGSEYAYQQLDDIHDICGVRIITYYADEVDAVAEIIRNEFSIDYTLSVDKRDLLDPDRFGYLSLHYIASLSESRLGLTEYARFCTCRAEIQIRSILQHTWAEIEHDLGYKTEVAVPRHIRRRFSQLAGLLELADENFAQIRDTLADYESTLPHEIDSTPESVQLDQASLLAFTQISPTVSLIDQKIASKLGTPLSTEASSILISRLVSRLNYLNITNIAELSETLGGRKDDIIRIAVSAINATPRKPPSGRRLTKGVSILYLFHLLLLERSPNSEVFATELLNSGYPQKLVTEACNKFSFFYEPTH